MYNNTLENDVTYNRVSKPFYNHFIYCTLDFRLIVNVNIIFFVVVVIIILWGPKGSG